MAEENNQWHLKKEINVAHVIVTISMVITMMWFFSDLDKRIDGNSIEIEHSKELRIEDVKRTHEGQTKLYTQLDKLNDKIDKLLAK